MKNKSTLLFCTFLLICCFSLTVNAQKKKANNDFTINVVKYSDRPNYENEHIHIIELKNNSKFKSNYTLSLASNNCNDKSSKLNDKKELNINAEIYFESSNKKQMAVDLISLEPNESIRMRVKTRRKKSAKLNSWNCSSISVTKLSQNKSKNAKANISESITIKTFVPNPNNKGH
ncbi:hypothetical protein DIS18_14805 [Algibacter marinivivus]|uniref:Lamin Tail Domain n=1 Tax=Algibacter marinivivus TaxID=2100723 RepID=A0A2U2X0U6_9FLAO|nr:hypothetical protein [Algibacter marinivivus]PWH81406.1 hypothetical protein DIS18_14805 [Algibacter marinivivus]